MNTRHELLQARSMNTVGASSNGCSIDSGQWNDFYTGSIVTEMRGILVLLALLVSLAPIASQGQSAEDCVEITNDSYRLACFDNLFGDGNGSTSQQATNATSQSTGVWDVGKVSVLYFK